MAESVKNNLQRFVDAVRCSGMDADITTAARHHSAVNVADADRVLSKVGGSDPDFAQRQRSGVRRHLAAAESGGDDKLAANGR